MNSNMDTPQEELLLQLLAKERGYYQTVLDIAREENSRLLAQCALADLQPLLKQKQIVLSCIQSIDHALTPLKRYWQSKKDRTDPLSTRIQEELGSLNILLSDILRTDLSSQKFAERHLADLKQRCSDRLEQSP